MSSSATLDSLWDDPQIWRQYSQPGHPDGMGRTHWESQVVVEGMHCAACAFTIEDALMAVPGVQSVKVNATTRRASVTWSPEQVSPSVWMHAIENAGYKAIPAQDHSLRHERQMETRRMLWRLLVAAFCMMQVMMYASPAYVTQPGEISPNTLQLLRWASWVLTLPVVFFSCMPFWRGAWHDLRTRRLSMDMPVALGMAIAFVVSTIGTFEPEGVFGREVYFDSLTMFVFFLLGGRWLEWRLRDQTAGALEALMNRLPESIERRTAQGWQRVALHALQVGDVVKVRAGEAFPGDGVITFGQTLVEEAMLTGESRPCGRGPQEQVMAGSHNLSATVEVCLQQVGPQTRYAQLVHLMEQASTSKPRLAQWADRLARPFLMGVLALAAAAVAQGWSTDPEHALMVALARRAPLPQWGTPIFTGMLWALLPCGLLYSALIVAALAGTPWQGAGVMATFALASGLVLGLGPWALLRWGQSIRAPGWGMRLAGLALTFSAAAALYLGLVHNQAPWCV